MIGRIREWLRVRAERIERERLQRQQKMDEAFFDCSFAFTKAHIMEMCDMSHEDKMRMMERAEKLKKDSLDARREQREAGKDVRIGF